MKLILVFLSSALLLGCVSDVSDLPPHKNLAGTVWKLKVNTYVIEYRDNPKRYYVIPCDNKHSAYFPDFKWEYNEGNIGNTDSDVTIVASLIKGDKIKVVRVLKDPHPTMGTSYIPMAAPIAPNLRIKEELIAKYLYEGFYEHGILNPEYATQVNK